MPRLLDPQRRGHHVTPRMLVTARDGRAEKYALNRDDVALLHAALDCAIAEASAGRLEGSARVRAMRPPTVLAIARALQEFLCDGTRPPRDPYAVWRADAAEHFDAYARGAAEIADPHESEPSPTAAHKPARLSIPPAGDGAALLDVDASIAAMNFADELAAGGDALPAIERNRLEALRAEAAALEARRGA